MQLKAGAKIATEGCAIDDFIAKNDRNASTGEFQLELAVSGSPFPELHKVRIVLNI